MITRTRALQGINSWLELSQTGYVLTNTTGTLALQGTDSWLELSRYVLTNTTRTRALQGTNLWLELSLTGYVLTNTTRTPPLQGTNSWLELSQTECVLTNTTYRANPAVFKHRLLSIVNSGGSRIFLRGCANSQKCDYFATFCRKLHENEKHLDLSGGRVVPGSANGKGYCSWKLIRRTYVETKILF